jgi:hypothetical protein
MEKEIIPLPLRGRVGADVSPVFSIEILYGSIGWM